MKKKFKTSLTFVLLAISLGISIVVVLGCIFTLLAHMGICPIHRTAQSVLDCICGLFVVIPNMILIVNYFDRFDKEKINKYGA